VSQLTTAVTSGVKGSKSSQQTRNLVITSGK